MINRNMKDFCEEVLREGRYGEDGLGAVGAGLVFRPGRRGAATER